MRVIILAAVIMAGCTVTSEESSLVPVPAETPHPMRTMTWPAPTPVATATPEPPQTPQEAIPAPVASQVAHRLTRDQFIATARAVGFEREHIITALHRVACGPGTYQGQVIPTGESGCDPSQQNINEHGRFIGLLQIWTGWAEACGVAAERLFVAAVNLACARIIIEDSEARGLDPFARWSVKPE